MKSLFKKSRIVALAFTSLMAVDAKAAMIISGMVDGTQSGGIPKVMEIVAGSNIPDLSNFWIVRDTNGAGPFDTFVQLPSISVNAGDFFYVYGNSGSTTSMTTLGFPDIATDFAIENGLLNWNLNYCP